VRRNWGALQLILARHLWRSVGQAALRHAHRTMGPTLWSLALPLTACTGTNPRASAEHAPACPTYDASYVGLGGFDPSVLPSGTCSGTPDCELPIAEPCGPACSGYGAVDGYRCTCAYGSWVCRMTSQGGGGGCGCTDAGWMDSGPAPDGG
jgi:hypothetical protein